MVSFFILGLCFFSVKHVTHGLQHSDHSVIVALLGDNISLPCAIPSVKKSCSSVNWNKSEADISISRVVTAGKVTTLNQPRFRVVKECSLQIDRLELDDAQPYICDDGKMNASVSLEVLQIKENKNEENVAKDKMELQCYLNANKGQRHCNHQGIHKGIHIQWLSEGNTKLEGNRFEIENSSNCLSKLTIKRKLTDHHRKWRCQLTQNMTVKTSLSYTTDFEDGIQEVFAVVGESVSFSCDTSADQVQWVGPQLSKNISLGKTHRIIKVTSWHSGDYNCSKRGQKVLNKFRLHTLDITAEDKSEGRNLTLNCVLTCAPPKCDQSFNLSWDGTSQYDAIPNTNPLVSKLFIADIQLRTKPVVCSAYREGVVMVVKKYHSTNTSHAVVWLALPLGLLLLAIGGVLGVYLRKKHKKRKENELVGIGMTHVYEDIDVLNHEEIIRPSNAKDPETSNKQSPYDLLQAVN